jgi:gamma-glutamyl phosphate reductase
VNKPERIDKADATDQAMRHLGQRAREAAHVLALASTESKNTALRAAAACLRKSTR